MKRRTSSSVASASVATTAAIFLDKDGTLIEDVPYNIEPKNIRIYPEVPSVLTALSSAGYKLLVVSNQPGIAHGYFDRIAVERAGNALMEMLLDAGARVDGFYYCPHHPDGKVRHYAARCECRKPQPGLLLQAAREHGIDLSASWVVGDILNDVEAGKRAGCRAALVDRGNETEWLPGKWRKPDLVVNNLDGLLRHLQQKSNVQISGIR